MSGSKAAPPITTGSKMGPPTITVAHPVTSGFKAAPPITTGSKTGPPTTSSSHPITSGSKAAPPTTMGSKVAPPTTSLLNTAPPTKRRAASVAIPSASSILSPHTLLSSETPAHSSLPHPPGKRQPRHRKAKGRAARKKEASYVSLDSPDLSDGDTATNFDSLLARAQTLKKPKVAGLRGKSEFPPKSMVCQNPSFSAGCTGSSGDNLRGCDSLRGSCGGSQGQRQQQQVMCGPQLPSGHRLGSEACLLSPSSASHSQASSGDDGSVAFVAVSVSGITAVSDAGSLIPRTGKGVGIPGKEVSIPGKDVSVPRATETSSTCSAVVTSEERASPGAGIDTTTAPKRRSKRLLRSGSEENTEDGSPSPPPRDPSLPLCKVATEPRRRRSKRLSACSEDSTDGVPSPPPADVFKSATKESKEPSADAKEWCGEDGWMATPVQTLPGYHHLRSRVVGKVISPGKSKRKKPFGEEEEREGESTHKQTGQRGGRELFSTELPSRSRGVSPDRKRRRVSMQKDKKETSVDLSQPVHQHCNSKELSRPQRHTEPPAPSPATLPSPSPSTLPPPSPSTLPSPLPATLPATSATTLPATLPATSPTTLPAPSPSPSPDEEMSEWCGGSSRDGEVGVVKQDMGVACDRHEGGGAMEVSLGGDSASCELQVGMCKPMETMLVSGCGQESDKGEVMEAVLVSGCGMGVVSEEEVLVSGCGMGVVSEEEAVLLSGCGGEELEEMLVTGCGGWQASGEEGVMEASATSTAVGEAEMEKAGEEKLCTDKEDAGEDEMKKGEVSNGEDVLKGGPEKQTLDKVRGDGVRVGVGEKRDGGRRGVVDKDVMEGGERGAECVGYQSEGEINVTVSPPGLSGQLVVVMTNDEGCSMEGECPGERGADTVEARVEGGDGELVMELDGDREWGVCQPPSERVHTPTQLSPQPLTISAANVASSSWDRGQRLCVKGQGSSGGLDVSVKEQVSWSRGQRLCVNSQGSSGGLGMSGKEQMSWGRGQRLGVEGRGSSGGLDVSVKEQTSWSKGQRLGVNGQVSSGGLDVSGMKQFKMDTTGIGYGGMPAPPTSYQGPVPASYQDPVPCPAGSRPLTSLDHFLSSGLEGGEQTPKVAPLGGATPPIHPDPSPHAPETRPLPLAQQQLNKAMQCPLPLPCWLVSGMTQVQGMYQHCSAASHHQAKKKGAGPNTPIFKQPKQNPQNCKLLRGLRGTEIVLPVALEAGKLYS